MFEYLGRYTYKVGISNYRILNKDNESVTFSSKDYRKGGQKSTVTLSDIEFIRRFAMHVLPKGFTRIRYYGILSSSQKKIVLSQLREELGVVCLVQKERIKYGVCPNCQTGELVLIRTFDNKGPPKHIKCIARDLLMTLKKIMSSWQMGEFCPGGSFISQRSH